MDDLTAPLGQNKPKKRRFAFSISHLFLASLAFSLVGFAGWAMLNHDPLGGEPIAVAPAEVRAEPAAKAAEEPAAAKAAASEVPARPNRYDGPAAGDGQQPVQIPPG